MRIADRAPHAHPRRLRRRSLQIGSTPPRWFGICSPAKKSALAGGDSQRTVRQWRCRDIGVREVGEQVAHVGLLAAAVAEAAQLLVEVAGRLAGQAREVARVGGLPIAAVAGDAGRHAARHVLAQVLADGVARQARASGYLPEGQLLPQCPTSDDTQCRHVNHSCAPAAKSSRLGFLRGSDLDGNRRA